MIRSNSYKTPSPGYATSIQRNCIKDFSSPFSLESADDRPEFDFPDHESFHDEDNFLDSSNGESSKKSRTTRYVWVSKRVYFESLEKFYEYLDSKSLIFEQSYHSKRKQILIGEFYFYRYYVFSCSEHKDCPQKVEF